MINPNMNNSLFPQMNYTNPTLQPHNGIKWVQGIEGAKAYQLMPNSNDVFLDSENEGIFYIKVADNVGMCTLRTFKYEEITSNPMSNTVDMSGYVKKDELATMVKSIIKESKNEQSVQTTKSNKTITQ